MRTTTYGKTCQVEECRTPAYVRGWCGPHYKRWKRYGDPTAGGPYVDRSPDPDRFFAKVNRSGECWLWTGSLASGGYGSFYERAGKRKWKAHRFSYELAYGPVPAGLDLDHLCRVRHCVNPAHLEPVTRSQNLRRGESSTRSRCPYGHEFTPENTHLTKQGWRQCRACWKRKRA